MVNPSSLASAGAAAAAALGIGGDAAATATGVVQSAAVAAAKKAIEARSAWPVHGRPPFLLDAATVKRLSLALGTILRGGGRTAVPGYAPPSRTTSSSSPSTSSASSRSALSFLSDPKLSIEEKLMRLMAYLNDKWEKEMEAKMKQLAGESAPASSSSSSSKKKKSGGILGKVAGAVSSFMGGGALQAVSGFLNIPGVKSVLGKIAGPVLAAAASALGFPMAAPLLLQYGSKVVDLVDGVAGASSSSSSSSGSSSSSSTSATKDLSDSERQLLMTQIQRLQDKQKEMFGLVSNILKGNHDTRMAVINNLR